MNTFYSLIVVYKGYDSEMDNRICKAFRGTGLVNDGSGYFICTNERDLVFFSKGKLKPSQLKTIRNTIKNVRRWKGITAVSFSKEVDD